MSKTLMMLSGFVEKTVRSQVDGSPRTITVDVMARWDVDSENGLIIGSQGTVDASLCMLKTDVTFTPPTS
jgi:hypothetical protein